jgi:predicted SprT family Zn-dependent metalloprotease
MGMPIMTKRIKCSMLVLFIVIAGMVIYSVLFGTLFAYSPIFIGFSKYELSHVIVYIQDEIEYSDYQDFDKLTQPVEDFHQLIFTEKPKLFIFRDRESYLQRSMTKARFYAYPNGSLVISPWALKEAEENKISLDTYLRHELSHTLLFQHMGILEAYRYYPRWLLEGIAVYSTNQMGTSWYPSKDETYDSIRKGSFMPPKYFKTKREDQINVDVEHRVAFMYSEFACIVDYLIRTYGKDRFLSYMKELFNNRKHDSVFKNNYGIAFDECIRDSRESVTADEHGKCNTAGPDGHKPAGSTVTFEPAAG